MTEFGFFHSFPRPKSREEAGSEKQREKGRKILRMILSSGLLLTTEHNIFTLPWPTSDGDIWEIDIEQNRFCMTYVSVGELDRHSQSFGPFHLEIDWKGIMKFGALPVIYLPVKSENIEGLADIGKAFVYRLCHIQEILQNLIKSQHDSKEKECSCLKNINTGYSFEELHATVKRLSQFFCPTERESGTGSEWLNYYKQREWRFVSGIVNQDPHYRSLTQIEKNALCDLDTKFFTDTFSDGIQRVDSSCYIDIAKCGPFLKRIIVPKQEVECVKEIVNACSKVDMQVISS